MRRLFVALSSAVSVVALTHMASAADLSPQLVYKAAPLPPPVQDWSGVYVGLQGGYGWGQENINPAFDPFFKGKLSKESCKELFDNSLVTSFTCNHPTIGSVSQSGWLAGGHAGVQKQWGSLVLGFDAQISGADIKGNTTSANVNTAVFAPVICASVADETLCRPSRGGTRTVNSSQTIDKDIDLLSMFGPKIGWAFSPNWMAYVEGGAAFEHETADNSVSQSHFFTPTGGTPYPTHIDLNESDSGGLSQFGWAVGGGVDYKWQLSPGSAVILGVQYMHYQFGSDTLTLTDNLATGRSIALNTSQTVDVVTGRISYLFSIH